MKSRKGTQTTDAKEAGRSENAIILILDLTLSDFSRPQLYAIWSVSIFPERLSGKCVGWNPKRRRMPIRLQKRDVDPGFTTHYLYNSTLQKVTTLYENQISLDNRVSLDLRRHSIGTSNHVLG